MSSGAWRPARSGRLGPTCAARSPTRAAWAWCWPPASRVREGCVLAAAVGLGGGEAGLGGAGGAQLRLTPAPPCHRVPCPPHPPPPRSRRLCQGLPDVRLHHQLGRHRGVPVLHRAVVGARRLCPALWPGPPGRRPRQRGHVGAGHHGRPGLRRHVRHVSVRAGPAGGCGRRGVTVGRTASDCICYVSSVGRTRTASILPSRLHFRPPPASDAPCLPVGACVRGNHFVAGARPPVCKKPLPHSNSPRPPHSKHGSCALHGGREAAGGRGRRAARHAARRTARQPPTTHQ